MGIAVQYSLALVVVDGSLLLINITDPKHPRIIGSQLMFGIPESVAVQGSLALVASGDGSVQMVNISHPQHPAIIDSIDVGVANRLVVQDNLAFVTSRSGLNILQFGLSGGVLSGRPSKTDHGNYNITITACNSDGISANTTFRISVNNPPVWKTPLAPKIVNVGQVMSFQLPVDVFWDEDGDPLTFRSTLADGEPLPNWITFFAAGQIYTIIPNSNNRGQYNISITVDDGYYGAAQAWFSLIVPIRRPIKVNDIPSQNAFIWRPFKLIVSSETFKALDGDTLQFHAQLKGARPLPRWLRFDNKTCDTGCRFEGQPGVTDLSDLEIELIARSQGGDVGAEFSLLVNMSTLLEDLVKYYSASGAGLVFLSLLTRLWRWHQMRKIAPALITLESLQIPEVQTLGEGDEKESQVTYQTIEMQLQKLSEIVERRQTSALQQQVIQYSHQILDYAKQFPKRRILEFGNPWDVILKMAKEVERRTLYSFKSQDTLLWIKALQLVLQTIVDAETGRGRIVIKTDKEKLLTLLSKVRKFTDTRKQHGVQIKHQLELCQEALVSMDDTDSIKDNLCCRDSEMILEIIKTMIAPPYGVVRLMYQISNIPNGWYPAIIHLYHSAEKSLANINKLTQFQEELAQQKDWRVIYEGIGLLGKVARQTQDEKVQKQAVEGVQSQTKGLGYYENYRGSFWKRCSSCCDKQSAWIRERAQAEIESLSQVDLDPEAAVTFHQLQQPLLPALNVQ